MSKIHLSKGSTEPPKVPGKLRAYSMEYCPFAQRTRLVLLAKKIDHDVVNCNLQDKPEFLFKYHPEGKVPALYVNENEVIVESIDIGEYLNEKYPDPPLYPADPTAKQADKDLIEKIGPFVRVFIGSLYNKNEKTIEEWANDFLATLEPFESALKERGTPFFNGDYPGLVDYNLWPFIERGGSLKLYFGKPLIGEDESPYLRKWHKNMLSDPAAADTHIDTETFFKYFQRRFNNEPFDVDNL